MNASKQSWHKLTAHVSQALDSLIENAFTSCPLLEEELVVDCQTINTAAELGYQG